MGKFVKGTPKPPNSGRQKGVRPPMRSLRKGLAELGFDLSTELALLLKNPEISLDQQIAICKLIAQHTQAPPKAEDTAEVVDVEFSELSDQDIAAQLKSV